MTGGQVPDLIGELDGTLGGTPAIDTTNDLTPGAPGLNAVAVTDRSETTTPP